MEKGSLETSGSGKPRRFGLCRGTLGVRGKPATGSTDGSHATWRSVLDGTECRSSVFGQCFSGNPWKLIYNIYFYLLYSYLFYFLKKRFVNLRCLMRSQFQAPGKHRQVTSSVAKIMETYLLVPPNVLASSCSKQPCFQ